ncbi:MAG: hypothetical protein K2N71_10490 [Oscillospiraceae bacterium]|nr:hypothetical protein [Oscillospiraceae bacterium]
MKKTIVYLAAVITLMSLTACSDTVTDENLPADVSSATVSEQTSANEETAQNTASETVSETETETETESVSVTAEEPEETDVTVKALDGAEYVLAESFTPIYENVGFVERNSDGNPTTYEELQDFIPSYGNVTFLEYEIIAQYTPEEAFEKTGDEIFKHSTILYQAHIYYDHLNDTPVDMIVDLGKAGLPDSQIENDPPYAVGQKIIAPLSGYNTTCCVAIPELVYYVYEVNGVKLAYHVSSEKIVLESEAFANLDMELTDSERFLVTSTANNPVKFTQKSTVDDLTDFIRQDWEARGYDFFDVANFDYEGRIVNDSDEDVPVAE